MCEKLCSQLVIILEAFSQHKLTVKGIFECQSTPEENFLMSLYYQIEVEVEH